ncbi:Cilia- and flagella-associated protein 91 [Saguinus oedipus]|uniref:Cilia- and flagella-associated protein 91 n=1 Tax=Saguinus oedipus TaxID=9490 RepID=A0ABQ9U3Z5_SAGOE|nr:Cilia- and flagella-associated protein 91 [Saguinus oedipus]
MLLDKLTLKLTANYPLFIVSSEKDHIQANIQATLIRSRLVCLIHQPRLRNEPETSSLLNCIDQID